MDVIGVGLGRTGTTSLAKALDILGFGPVYHTRELFRDPAKLTTWWQVVDQDYRDWDAVFAGYTATVDWPAAAYWRELVEHYPDAMVILTVRDPKRWSASCRNTIFIGYRRDRVSRMLLALMRIPLRVGDPRLQTFRPLYDRIYRRHFGDGDLRSEALAVSVYEQHVAAVRATVPRDRLLEFSVMEGWQPLCKFLGVSATPTQDFPHSNDGAAWWKVTSRYLRRGLARLAGRRNIADFDPSPSDTFGVRDTRQLADEPQPLTSRPGSP